MQWCSLTEPEMLQFPALSESSCSTASAGSAAAAAAAVVAAVLPLPLMLIIAATLLGQLKIVE